MLFSMKRSLGGIWFGLLLVGIFLIGFQQNVIAADPQFPPKTSNGSVGLQGKISTDPPKRGATITTPSNGASFSQVPITISGICPTNVLVKVFSNNVFVGSTLCINGSYSIQANLFPGQNELIAKVYDALDQSGPDSNVVTVTFNDAQYLQFGTHVSLTSQYAVRGAPPGQELIWPILLSGGNGPYAISVDWGDGSPTDLISQLTAGLINIKHIYKTAGVYQIIVKVSDKNGGTAFLQLVGQATGAAQSNSKSGQGESVVRTQVLWWPALVMLPLIGGAFWVGQRSELYTLRKQLEKTRDSQ